MIRRADDFRLVSELVNSALFLYIYKKQEGIPVGCVPSAAVAVSGGGGFCLWGEKGVVCQGGCTPPSPWTEFLAHACENITFVQLLLRTVENV